MKKKSIIMMLISMVLVLGLTACSGGDSAEAEKEKEVTYQSILDDYTAKLGEATPKLVDEYNSEAAGITDINELAKICTTKTEALAKICTDGVSEMAKLKLEKGDDDATYTEWATKLQDVYSTDAMQITDAYTSSAIG